MNAHGHPRHLGTQRGVALLTALVILAIAATLSAGMIWRRELDTRRTANIIQGDQAMEYALGAEAWAEQILRRDLQQNSNVNLNQDWAQQLPPLPVEGGAITGHMDDLQGLFNLNNLASSNVQQSTAALAQFQRLLIALDLDPEIATAVSDWVNPGQQPSVPGGAKDEYYTRLQPPYNTAEQPMTSISELLLVKGATPAIYAQLLPYVCALPLQAPGSIPGTPMLPTAINLNTAPAPILASLNNGLSVSNAAAAIEARNQHPFQDTSDLTQLVQVNTAAGIVTGLSSGFFRLTVHVQIGSAQTTLYSLLYRTQAGAFVAIRRTFGTL